MQYLFWLPFLLVAFLAVRGLVWSMADRALRRGDYDRALLWYRFGPPAARLRAGALALGGRFQEAEAIFLKLTAKSPRDWDALADVLIDQGRFAEARPCLDQAMAFEIGHGAPCHEYASWYLRQGIEPEKALEFVDQAIAAQKRLANPVAGILPGRLASKAWALAQLGRHQEAEAAIEEALRVARARTKLPATWSFLHWTSGNAYAAMHQPAKSREHYEQAAQIDPHGNYGKKARAALQSS